MDRETEIDRREERDNGAVRDIEIRMSHGGNNTLG